MRKDPLKNFAVKQEGSRVILSVGLFPLAIEPPTNLITYVTTPLQSMQANFHSEALTDSLGVLNLGEWQGES